MSTGYLARSWRNAGPDGSAGRASVRGRLGCVARLIGLLLIVCPLTLQAEIYKRVLPDGTVIYTDQPQPGAQEIKPPPPQIVPSFRPPERAKPEGKGGEKNPAPYALLEIVSPTDDAVIWNDEGDVEVWVRIEPALQAGAGHRLVLSLDGKPVAGPSAGTRFTLRNVFRGTHVLQAEVRDRNGDTLITAKPVTFHLKQHSILFQRGR